MAKDERSKGHQGGKICPHGKNRGGFLKEVAFISMRL